MNSVYLYLHRIMKEVSPDDNIIERKQALFIISRYFKFIPNLKKEVLNDMVELELIVRVNRDKIKVVNHELSEDLDAGLIAKILESGMRQKSLFVASVFLSIFLINFIKGLVIKEVS